MYMDVGQREDRWDRGKGTVSQLEMYGRYLYEQEKNPRTIQKYLHDVKCFLQFLGEREPDRAAVVACKQEPDRMEAAAYRQESDRATAAAYKQEPDRAAVVAYKQELARRYQLTSANSMLTALNGYLRFLGRSDCCVRLYRIQRQIFTEEEKELTRKEYDRLVKAADRAGNERLSCILQTMASTGIRVGELSCITAEALKRQMAVIDCKGKERRIPLSRALVQLLSEYCRHRGIRSGCVFVTRSGRPMDRRNVWAEMKGLCRPAGVAPSKVFPHNLRHLFARLYYEKRRDIVRLADYLGHSSVETTRRYTRISSMEVCRRQLELGLLAGEREEGRQQGRRKKRRA